MERWMATMVLSALSTASGGDAFTPIRPGPIEVGGEIGRRVDVTLNNNLLALDADRDFLAPFKTKVKTSGYVGLGKLIDAAVRFAVQTGDPRAMALKERLVREAIAAQGADGYIGMFAPGSRMHGMWDIHEMGYLVYALAVDYEFSKNQPSLDAAKKAADYILAHWKELPADWDGQTRIATHVSVTGLERAMLALHRVTGDARYLDFCLEERALAEWDLDIVVGRRVGIEGHIYAYLCRCLAQLELYRLRPEEKLLGQTRKAIDYMVGNDGMTITGGCGQWEIWTDDQDGRGHLAETCATAYLLRSCMGTRVRRGDQDGFRVEADRVQRSLESRDLLLSARLRARSE